jgi:DNA-nicking Smr family endonuclease
MAKDQESRPLSKRGGKRPAGQSLSEEERALWEHAARDLQPLKGKKSRVHGTLADAAGAFPEHPRAQEKPAPPPRAVTRPAKVAKTPAGPPLPSPLDRRKARQIGSGRIEVEARIDLHGMRQSEAHTALRRFLAQAYAGGRRWVLVITGKGAPLRRGSEEEADDGALYRDRERGVLRRNVPRWLAEPELRSIVVGFAAAAIRHGGDGALYVQLRRKDRPRG